MAHVQDIIHHRLYNQRIGPGKFELPGQVVTWFGAMQAQDYASAQWAIGLRCQHASLAAIEQAVADKSIARTWAMRGTLQVVAVADLRWMLTLLAPRIIANSAHRRRQLELDAAVFARSFEIFGKLLQGGKPVTRAELMLALEQAGIAPANQRGYHILHQAALERLICFGPLQGKQDTFVLLDEWAPQGKMLDRDEALAELARRYFQSHGPATLQDFVWWSGLTTGEARAALEAIKSRLHPETFEGQIYWLTENGLGSKDPSPAAYLLPAFDEYFLGYQTRAIILDSQYDKRAVSSNGVFRPMMVIDGQVVGIWKREIKKKAVVITLEPFNALTTAEEQALLLAANQYGAFMDLPVVL